MSTTLVTYLLLIVKAPLFIIFKQDDPKARILISAGGKGWHPRSTPLNCNRLKYLTNTDELKVSVTNDGDLKRFSLTSPLTAPLYILSHLARKTAEDCY